MTEEQLEAEALTGLDLMLKYETVESTIDALCKKLPWAHAVWLQRNAKGWVAFVRADMGGYAAPPQTTAWLALTKLWMHYEKLKWKQVCPKTTNKKENN